MNSSQHPNLFALLVGINTWKWDKIKPLSGCLNDVDLMHQTLVDHYQADANQIKVIKGENATHAAIVDAFRSHLIENAKHSANDDSAAFLFHYSGHGSRCKNPAKPLGKDESLVPWDSRVDGVVDIKDWELGELIDELTEFSNNVTIVLDCCHSGSGTRDETNVRECLEDDSEQPDLIAHTTGTRSAVATIQTSAPTMKSPEKYALLAGCRSDQGAFEYEHVEGETITHYGLTTYMLCQELKKPEAKQRTYRELLEQLTPTVQEVKPQQIPQCEGDVDRVFLSPYRPLRNLFLKVFEVRDGLYWVNAGLAHGLREGTQLHVYPSGARRAFDGESPLATLVVDEAGATTAGCVVLGNAAVIPVNSRVAVYRRQRESLKRKVSVSGATQPQLDALKARCERVDAQDLFEFVDGDTAEIQLSMVGDRWGVKAAGTAEFWSDENHLDLVISRIRELTHYVDTLAIRNNSPSSVLAGQLQLSLKRPDLDPVSGARIYTDIPPADDGMIELTANQDRIVFELLNTSSSDLWFVVLAFGYDGSISQIYPKTRGTHDLIQKNMTAPFVSKRFRPSFAPGEEENSGVIETIKVIAATSETDFEFLLRNRIAATPPPPPADAGTRLLSAEDDESAEDHWMTAEVSYRLVSESPHKSQQRLERAQPIQISGTTLQVIPPANFEAKMRLSPAPVKQRSLEASTTDQLPQDTVTSKLRNIAVPLNWRSSRSIGEASLELELEMEKDQLERVTEATPLMLRSPQFQSAEEYAVIATDGKSLFPVGGTTEAGLVSIDWLPQEETLVEETTTTRSLSRTLKLYVFKLLQWPTGTLGLHAASFVSEESVSAHPATAKDRVVKVANGEVRYRQVSAEQIKPGERIALHVHGFNSDTFWMVPKLSDIFEQNQLSYDHHLTFDYESLATSVRDNGKALAEALTRLGFSKEDGVHVDLFAHSMGCVVSRSMIELEGGRDYIDRCFMAGPPNLGTPLADTGKLLTGLAITLLNFASGSTIGDWAGKALKKVTADTVGPFDLKPSSKLYQDLSQTEPAGTVPYFILAGNAELDTDAQGFLRSFWNTLNKGANVTLKSLFDGQHDLVIGVSSMTGVQNGQYPAHLLKSAVVDSDHFDYFDKPDSQQQLVNWLRSK